MFQLNTINTNNPTKGTDGIQHQTLISKTLFQPREVVSKKVWTLEEMLEDDIEDHVEDEEDFIPEEDIRSFLDKSEDMAIRRQQLRENLKQRFAQLCIQGVPQID